jgi:chemotaxis protein MotB
VARRRQQHEEHDNLERWLVSYADFVTLLFAFFVVMYAISSVNEGKYRVLSETFTEAFREPGRGKPTAPAPAPTPPGEPAVIELPLQQQPSPMQQTAAAGEASVLESGGAASAVDTDGRAVDLGKVAERIGETLQSFVDKQLVDVQRVGDTIEVDMKSQMLFESGSARLSQQALPALEGLGKVLRPLANTVRVEGHTDNRPIATLQFPSNWELSAARAASVVHFLMRVGIPPSRMAAIGYGEHRPVTDNASEDGRARNRRVTLIIVGTKDVPAPPSMAASAAGDGASASVP